MAALRSALILKVRQRTDLVGASYISDAEISDWLSYSLAELYERLVTSFEDYSVVYSTQTVTSATATGFTVPSDFFKILRLDKSLSGSAAANDWVRLRRVNIRDESNWNQALMLRVGSSARAYGYVLVDSQVRILPQSEVLGTYQLLYYPTWETACLSADADPLVTVGPPGQNWEEYAIVDACIKACGKAELDPSLFAAQKAALVDRIQSIAQNRNAGEAEPPPANEVPWYERGNTTWAPNGVWIGWGP